MNPMTNVKNITKLNEIELKYGANERTSWHYLYKDSAWIFVGGLPYDLTEGDVICVFSQYGEIVNINLVRDKRTGCSKGFCFLCYENQKSTILAVDNFNGIKLCGRTLRVDHVANYRPPKEHGDEDPVTRSLHSEGCAPKHSESLDSEDEEKATKTVSKEKAKKLKKEKKKKKKKMKKNKKKKHRNDSLSDTASTDSEDSHLSSSVKLKKEKYDPGYDKHSYTTKDSRHDDSDDHSSTADKTDNPGEPDKYNSMEKHRHWTSDSLSKNFRKKMQRSPSNSDYSSDDKPESKFESKYDHRKHDRNFDKRELSFEREYRDDTKKPRNMYPEKEDSSFNFRDNKSFSRPPYFRDTNYNRPPFNRDQRKPNGRYHYMEDRSRNYYSDREYKGYQDYGQKNPNNFRDNNQFGSTRFEPRNSFYRQRNFHMNKTQRQWDDRSYNRSRSRSDERPRERGRPNFRFQRHDNSYRR